jgi:pyruvate dehydrogenase E2 component (dihydrolipoamide acetyltransferase)
MPVLEVRIPDIGDFKGVEVIEVLVKPGDAVQKEQPLLTLESEKATMEVPSSAAGTVTELKVRAGDKVSQGDLVLLLDTAAGESAAAAPPASETQPAEPGPAPGKSQPPPAPAPETTAPPEAPRPATPVALSAAMHVSTTPGAVHASPSIRLFARELGVDLSKVSGSGPKGRIQREDVQKFVKGVMSGSVAVAPAASASPGLPQMPVVDFARFGPVENKPLSRIRKLSAVHLHRSWVLVPHVTQFDDADITDLDAFRRESGEEAKRKGIKLTMLSFLLKASATTLLEFPELNSSLSPEGDALILKKYVHVGIAVDTPNGLVVPVVRDVDKKGIFQLARELGELSEKARIGKLAPGDMQGGCFSISSLGGIGGTKFTPIVNAPEVAILGVSKSQMRPVWDGKSMAFVPRLILPLSLSYDHRVIDGAQAARVTTFLAELLGDIRRLLL